MRYQRILAVVVFFCLTACKQSAEMATQAESNDLSLRVSAAQLMQCEFNDVLGGCDSQGMYAGMTPRSIFYGLKKPLHELTPEEQRFMDGWVKPNRIGGNDVLTVQTFVREFYQANNRMPENGAELVAWHLQTRPSPMSVQEFESLSADRQVQISFFAINAITGRFFTSYSRPEWTLGGVNLRQLEGQALSDKLAQFDYDPAGVSEAWLMDVYGSTPGETIAEQVIIMSSHQYMHNQRERIGDKVAELEAKHAE